MCIRDSTYTVKAVSRRFDKPEFSAPQFGDEQVVVVQSRMNTRAVRSNFCHGENDSERGMADKSFLFFLEYFGSSRDVYKRQFVLC